MIPLVTQRRRKVCKGFYEIDSVDIVHDFGKSMNLGADFAIANAMKAFNPRYQLKFHSPMTPEKFLWGLYGK